MKKKLICSLSASNQCWLIKTILVLEFAVILSLFTFMNVLAIDTSSINTKLTIKLKSSSIEDVLLEIEKNSGYFFLYNNKLIDVTRKVDVNFKDMNIKEILQELFADKNIEYIIKDRQIILSPENFDLILDNNTQEDKIIVSGKVLSETNEILPGVNIVEKGTTNGVVTDLEGNFTITVGSQSSVLVFSYIGYNSEEIEVGSQTAIDIILVPSLEYLDEVVVVGYGIQKKSDVTGAIVSVNEENLQEVPAANVSQALQGRAAGLEIVRTSTKPGSIPQIRIRGNRSLSASNDPLVVLDGIPYEGSINDLNPDNILSVEVLKDASATAIYGSRGSNGVIIITTKRGEAGKTQVSYNGYYGISKVARKYEVYNGEEFADLREQSNYGTWLDVELESIELGRSTDWQDLIYKDGYITNHDLSTSGGTDDTQYSISAGYYGEETVLPGQSFKRFSLRTTIDHTIGKRIKIGLNSMNSYAITNGETVSPMYQILTLSPLAIPYDENGGMILAPASPIDDMTNPLTLYNEDSWEETRKRLRTFNSLYGELEILKGLKYRLNVGLDLNQDKFGQYYGSDTPMKDGKLSTARVDNNYSYSYTIENLLLYEKIFSDKHKINFTGLFSIQEYECDSNRVEAQDVVADYIQYYNFELANQLTAARGNYIKWDILSYMGRINYGYNNRYLLTFTVRADGSSRLAEGNKWHYYPAVAVAWNVHNESFMNNINSISYLKFRLGYGQTSNTAVDPYKTLGGLSRQEYSFGSTGVYGYYVSNLANYDLSWEYTTTTNLGIDFGILANRINGSLELYLQQTKDILLEKSLPPTSGIAGKFLVNVGETQNKGLELTLNTNIISNKNGFNWSTDINFFLNREEIVALANPGQEQDIGNGWFVGHPINVIYDFNKIGIWQSEDSVLAWEVYRQQPGQIRVEDRDTIPGIRDTDRMIIGDFQPKWQGGITMRFSYKRIDLSAVAFARVGGKLVSTMYQPSSYLNMLSGRRSGIKIDYWTYDDPNNDYPRPDAKFENTVYGSTLGYFDATFLKIRSINLGYTIPEKWINKAGMGYMRIYVIAQNPFTLFSPYLKAGGVDPEPTARGGSDEKAVQDRILTVGASTPPTRSYIFGLNFKF
jgi:TonB-linked SusC/RagA family outer membrane protein